VGTPAFFWRCHTGEDSVSPASCFRIQPPTEIRIDEQENGLAEDLSHLWTMTLVLPHVERLDDDQMLVYFPDYEAIAKLQVRSPELNANRALLRRDRSCPGCGRSKSEIFRRSETAGSGRSERQCRA